MHTVQSVLNGHSKKRQSKGLNDKWKLNEGQKYCRMRQGEHSPLVAFCNTFDLQLAIIGLENQFSVFLRVVVFTQVLLYVYEYLY